MATTPTQVQSDVKNFELADLGKKRIDWANQSMKVLQIIRKEFIKNQPLKGIRVSACLHVTTETANLAITLRDGGADVVLCASNPLSTQDDVAASLVRISTEGTARRTSFLIIWRKLLAARAIAMFDNSAKASRSRSVKGTNDWGITGL